jgi:copper chaperone NosL
MTTATTGFILAAVSIVVIACGASVPPPAVLDATHEPCGSCRMVVSDPRFASQIVAPYEEPKFFDDLGCLTRYLAETPALPKGAVVYVADHRTKAWVRADRAVYTRVDALAAPMGSRVVAHETAASRDADQDASKGTPLVVADVFPAGRLPGGLP